MRTYYTMTNGDIVASDNESEWLQDNYTEDYQTVTVEIAGVEVEVELYLEFDDIEEDLNFEDFVNETFDLDDKSEFWDFLIDNPFSFLECQSVDIEEIGEELIRIVNESEWGGYEKTICRWLCSYYEYEFDIKAKGIDRNVIRGLELDFDEAVKMLGEVQ